MLNFKWDFPIESSKAGNEGINSGTGTAFEDIPIISLAREALQNSLDARDPDCNQPVKVEIAFDYIPLTDLPNFLDLNAHFEGILSSPNSKEELFKNRLLEGLENNGRVMPALRISDFNTLGMDYNSDPRVEKAPALNAFIGTGMNSKNDNQSNGGSRGWGKGVFFELSPIRAILVSTLSKKDQRNYFIGKTSFCHHFIGDTLYRNFGVYSDIEQEPSSNVPASIGRHRTDNRYGSDIYIMGMKGDTEKVRKDLIKSIIQNYWCAIAKNELEITIKGNRDLADCHINSRTLPNFFRGKVKQYNITFRDLDVANVKIESFQPKPYYEAYINAENNVREIGDKSFYYFEEDLPSLGLCKFYMVKNSEIGTSKIVYMRKTHMTIFCEQNRTMTSGFYGLFICDSITGDKLLTDMEGPAHDKWSVSIARNRAMLNEEEAEVAAKTALQEIKSFIDQCIKRVFDFSKIEEFAIPGLEMGFEVNAKGETGNREEDSKLGKGRWAVISVQEKKNASKTTETSSVTIDTHVVADEDGSSEGGRDHGDHGKSKHRRVSPGNKRNYSASNHGKEGLVNCPFKAEIRTYPLTREDKNYNVILIKSQEDINNAYISVDVVTEQKSIVLDIKECKVDGEPQRSENNMFKIDKLSKDKIYQVELLFDDNMIHTIKVGSFVKTDNH